MQRVSVVGNSGSGKTTLAIQLAASLQAPRLELDGLFQQANWQPLPTDEFRAVVSEFVAADSWVIDGNYYSKVQDLVWQRADTVVWLDPPRWRVMRQLLGRTLRRMARRTELWNGNRERWTSLLRVDPRESILAWAWTQHQAYRERYLRAMADPAHAHLEFVRLRTPAQVASFARAARRRPPG